MDKAGTFRTVGLQDEEHSTKELNALHKTHFVKVLTTCVDAEGNIIHTLYLKPRPVQTDPYIGMSKSDKIKFIEDV